MKARSATLEYTMGWRKLVTAIRLLLQLLLLVVLLLLGWPGTKKAAAGPLLLNAGCNRVDCSKSRQEQV
jgi:hypothetical protein